MKSVRRSCLEATINHTVKHETFSANDVLFISIVALQPLNSTLFNLVWICPVLFKKEKDRINIRVPDDRYESFEQ